MCFNDCHLNIIKNEIIYKSFKCMTLIVYNGNEKKKD